METVNMLVVCWICCVMLVGVFAMLVFGIWWSAMRARGGCVCCMWRLLEDLEFEFGLFVL